MQVNQVLAAALLAVTAVGAMSQEIDRDQLLSARAQELQTQTAPAGRTRASVAAETRNIEARGELHAVGEKADAPVVATVPATSPDQQQATQLSRAQVKADLAAYRATHKMRVGELG